MALTNKKLIGARDPLGIRPLVIGELHGRYILASETCALDIIGARFVRDVENGEDRRDLGGRHRVDALRAEAGPPPLHLRIHLLLPSGFGGERAAVYDVRKNMGRELAREAPARADVIIPVPDSGVPAALGFAQACGVPTSSESSATIMWAAPSSSRRKPCASSACA